MEFPILVKDNFISNKQAELIYNLHQKEFLFPHGSLTGHGGSSFFYFLKHGPKSFLENINKNFNFSTILLNEARLFAIKHDIEHDLIVSNIWINIQNKNSVLLPHTHRNCLISGVVYLLVDKDSSDLVFINNSKEYRLSPMIGRLILFPSWLMHGSAKPNKSENRVVLSFNLSKPP